MITQHIEQQTPALQIYSIVSNISSFDDLEETHRRDTLAWIASGAQLFRIAKPDVPNKHLVSYFIVFDEVAQKVLLVDHKKAQLWLPPGGHVELNEHPQEAVKRECREELSLKADFWRNEPLFLTTAVTVGLTVGHTDVSFWYVIRGDSSLEYTFDKDEFEAIKWFSFDQIPYERTDPHMLRFINKLKTLI